MNLIRTLKDINKQKSYLSVFDDYIKNGLYIFSYQEFSFTRFSFKALFKNPKYFLYLVRINSNNKIEQTTAGYIKSGYMKLSFITESIVVSSFAKHPDLYFVAKQNIIKYIDKLCYPSATLLRFDDLKKRYIFERVEGKNTISLEQRKFLLLYLIESTQKNKIEEKEETIQTKTYHIIYAIQHGDARQENVIWKNDNDFDFKFIDFDSTGVYPALFDYFYFIFSSCFDYKEIINSKDTKIIINKYFGQEDSMDLYLSKFFKWFVDDYYNSNNKSKRDYILLKKFLELDLSSFQLTKNVIKDFCLDR